MKYKIYLYVLGLLIVMGSCSKDDDHAQVASMFISFVRANGAPVANGECIDPDTDYGIRLQIITEGSGSLRPTQVEYTLNGTINSMTFTKAGSQINPIVLTRGENIAQITQTGAIARITPIEQGGFELVD